MSKKSLSDITIGELSKLQHQISKEPYFFNSSLAIIAKHFLTIFLPLNVFSSSFKEIIEKFKEHNGNNKKIPSTQDEFYKFIASRYLSLEKSPKDCIFELYTKASADIYSINNQVNFIESELHDLQHKKTTEGRLDAENRYYKKLLEFYKLKNIDAKEEIVNFLAKDIKNVALQNASKNTFMRMPLIFPSGPYRYANRNFWGTNINSFDVRSFSDLSNKFLEFPIDTHNKMTELFKTNKDDFFIVTKKYIDDEIITDISNLVERNHILYKRKSVIKVILEHFVNKDYISFNNMVPLQIEGIFHDCCIELGIDQSRLDISSLNEKLRIIKSKMNNFLHYEYYSFRFPVIRNTVAHGALLEGDLERTAIMLLLDLYPVCELLSSKEIALNNSIKLLKVINSDNDYKSLTEWIDFVEIKIPEFYKMEEYTANALAMYDSDDFWAYMKKELEKTTDFENSRPINIVKKINGNKISREKCKLFFEQIPIVKQQKEQNSRDLRKLMQEFKKG